MAHDVDGVVQRLYDAETLDDAVRLVILAALQDGEAGLAARLEELLGKDEPGSSGGPDAPDTVAPSASTGSAAPAGRPVYLTHITVQGFRGIGPTARLGLRPGPGLTVVAGRNGCGKSSFAEAVEVALTGKSLRLTERSSIWGESWRNLDHGGSPEVTVGMTQEGRGRLDVGVCSNADLARQNLADLNVTGQPGLESSERLSLLALNPNIVTDPGPDGGTPVNLVSFTPGTSLGAGRGFGSAKERALLYLLLEDELQLQGWSRHAASVMLQGSLQRRERLLEWVGDLGDGYGDQINRDLQRRLLGMVRADGLDVDARLLLEQIGRRRSLRDDLKSPAAELVGRLTATLSKAGVDFLEPDLVILDEFQRFGELLDPTSPAGELAGELLDHPDARVLMLSATPYKPFTYAEEPAVDDHHRDFMRTVRFLTGDDVRLHEEIDRV